MGLRQASSAERMDCSLHSPSATSGLYIGLGCLTKHIAVFLLAPLFIVWLQRGQLKQIIRSPVRLAGENREERAFLGHLNMEPKNESLRIFITKLRRPEMNVAISSPLSQIHSFTLAVMPLFSGVGDQARHPVQSN